MMQKSEGYLFEKRQVIWIIEKKQVLLQTYSK